MSDFINIMPEDWNRMFKWELLTEHPIGFIDIKESEINGNNENNYKSKLEKIVNQQMKEKCTNTNFAMANIIWNYSLKQYWRMQETQNISSWRVMTAIESPFQ